MPFNFVRFNVMEFSQKILEVPLILNLTKIILVRGESSHADGETLKS